jgi:fumarate reductase flavoprotein subunit
MAHFTTDLLVIGAGLAGERAAIEAAMMGNDVTILSLVPPRRSHSCEAQGGMQAALGNTFKGQGDNPDIHFEDTVKGSDWGAEQDVVRLFVNTAPKAVRQMAYWGIPWNRVSKGKKRIPSSGEEYEDPSENEGLITARDFGGVKKWRTCYTADGTGHTLLYTMDNEVLKLGVTVHDRREAISLIHDGKRCYGAVVMDLRTGELHSYVSKATLIATGGYGRIYGISTNAIINEGNGMFVALNTGLVPLGNMEAVQFHPTGLFPTNILMTEGCRGDGGFLIDNEGHRFMPDYEPDKKELASRDVVSRRMITHIRQGKGVETPLGTYLYLDIRHLGEKHINTYLREVSDISRNFIDVDPVKQMIPVRPTQHYSMGGVRTNIDGAAYGLEGLYAAGEAACWDLHGFNRLGGNSVAETVVAGSIVGGGAGEYIQNTTLDYSMKLIEEHIKIDQQKIDMFIKTSGEKGEDPWKLRDEMEAVMWEKVGIYRNEKDLTAAVEKVQTLLDRAKNIRLRSNGKWVNPEVIYTLRLPGMLKLAYAIAKGALVRQESRGSHFREDYPQRNDTDWLKRTLAYWDISKDDLRLDYEPVTITESQPGDRGYGEGRPK